MRPDLDEFEELNEADAPRSRAMSWLVLVVAVGGFAALAYYAYHSGSQSMKDGQVLVVEAETTPIKDTPADPEGEEFANKDKTIYDAISPSTAAKTEKLLPEPAQPVIPEPAKVEATEEPKTDAATTTTFVNKSVDTEKTVDPVDAQSLKNGGPETAPETKTAETSTVTTVNEVPVATKAVPVETKPAPAPAPKSTATTEPKIVNVKQTAPSAGSYKIQLGAFASESEARSQWNKITGKHGDIVKGNPIIIKIDQNGKTLYRLRATGYASAEAAKSACAKLSAKGQACFPAGK